MKVDRPNPEVYRLAAQNIREMRHDYSCVAISVAFYQIYKPSHGLDRLCLQYIEQYRKMFGPVGAGEVSAKAQRGAQFWDKWAPPGEKRRELRAHRECCLLMMAEICENPQ